MSKFENQVTVVTGAASGIGEACVRKLISADANVVGADTNQEKLDSLATEFHSRRFKTVYCDVSSKMSCDSCIRTALSEYSKLDILINSAGISRRTIGEETNFEQAWDSVMAVNLKGSMLMSKAAVSAMRQNNPTGGAIVNIGSIMSSVVYHAEDNLSDGFNPYPHSKGAILQLTRDTAVHHAMHGIRVNAVCPGFVDTELTAGLQNNPLLHQNLLKRHPIGRFGTADEIANVILFLASSDASFVTGACWNVDGGYLAT